MLGMELSWGKSPTSLDLMFLALKMRYIKPTIQYCIKLKCNVHEASHT